MEDAAAWGFEPAAIQNWAAENQNLHAQPGSVNPGLGSTANEAAIVQDASGSSSAVQFTDSLDAVSSLFMTQTISNDVMLNSAIGGQTDWVTTFPTKRQYVTNGLGPIVGGIAPFTSGYYGVTLNTAETAYIEELSCEPLDFQSWDREEMTAGLGGPGFSPSPIGPRGAEICNEQHVVAWGAAGTESALNVERDLVNLSFPYTEGWSRWTFNDPGHFLPYGNAQSVLLGLPAQGFAAYKYANGSTGGVMMNYGHVADHKTNTVISTGIGR